MSHTFTYYKLFISIVDDLKHITVQLYIIALSQNFGVQYVPLTNYKQNLLWHPTTNDMLFIPTLI
jgi:hypothetical protein